jgi:hypothetical protein
MFSINYSFASTTTIPPSDCKQQIREVFDALDPVELLSQIREAQTRLLNH